MDETEHEHLHLFEGGLRSFSHAHPHPKDDHDPLAAKPHNHINGYHTHPHNHVWYMPLAEGEERRPIIAMGETEYR